MGFWVWVMTSLAKAMDLQKNAISPPNQDLRFKKISSPVITILDLTFLLLVWGWRARATGKHAGLRLKFLLQTCFVWQAGTPTPTLVRLNCFKWSTHSPVCLRLYYYLLLNSFSWGHLESSTFCLFLNTLKNGSVFQNNDTCLYFWLGT